ncbi:hypothetical protein TNCV_2286501 [Trichonephila clavipes]|nr:hypothetical protein TNCV_2286501 [Trichonephila clavipes]
MEMKQRPECYTGKDFKRSSYKNCQTFERIHQELVDRLMLSKMKWAMEDNTELLKWAIVDNTELLKRKKKLRTEEIAKCYCYKHGRGRMERKYSS